MTDPIADFIIRIKNAHMARLNVVEAPFSNLKKSIADILVNEGYINSVKVQGDMPFSKIVVALKYVGKQPAISEVKRLSKPGRRLYTASGAIPKTLGGYGITILSTSKGIMTDTQARKENVGGELLCQIW